MKHFTKLLFVLMLSMTCSWAIASKTVTVDLSAHHNQDTGVKLGVEDFDDVTLTFAANGGVDPIYYYNHFRFYEKNQLSIKAKNGKKIVKVQFGVVARKFLKKASVTPSNYTYTFKSDDSGTTQEINGQDADSICVTSLDSAGQARINVITITLNDGGAKAADPDELDLSKSDCGMIDSTTFLTWNVKNASIIVANPTGNALQNPTYNVNHLRLKDGDTFTVRAKSNVEAVVFKYVTGRDPLKQGATYTVTPASYQFNAKMDTLAGSGQSEITFSTNKQVRINYIKVIYQGGGEDNPIDIHDNYVMMPSVVVNSADQLPVSANPNCIYYVNEKSTLTDDKYNLVYVGVNATVCFGMTLHEGYPFENVMGYHIGKVDYKTKITKKLQAICLPFPTAVPDSVRAFTFAGVDGKSFNFSQVDTLKAYKPYLIEASAQADTLTDFGTGWGIFNMPITPAFGPKVEVGDFFFQGTTLSRQVADVATQAVYGLEGDKWNKLTGAILPLSAFVAGNGDDDYATKLNGMPTSINLISTDANGNRVVRIYSIDGRYLGTDISVLPHGIFIVDGKKIAK